LRAERLFALAEQAALEEKIFNGLEPGQLITGMVNRIVDFGAFVDLGGIDGLIHISELSWGRVKKVADVLSEGQKVEAYVLKVSRVKGKGKISLSLKNPVDDPWDSVSEKYAVGQIVESKIVRLVQFGAFAEIEQGIDGLIHISQIASKHVVKPDDELSIGQVVSVKITDIDMEKRKISLSKKEADSFYAKESGEDVGEDVGSDAGADIGSDNDIREDVGGEAGQVSGSDQSAEPAEVAEAVAEPAE
jgi:4-hydroxy-3-methylbut-2-enyl diphosphate reductase